MLPRDNGLLVIFSRPCGSEFAGFSHMLFTPGGELL
jgi:hypothetical protein